MARMEKGRCVHKVLVGKPEGKRTLGRPRRRWEDNNKVDFEEVERGCGDWMELAEHRDTCEYGNELSGSKNAGNF